MIYLILLLLSANCYARDGRFECGSNGRFEYCIDGIPGCVVGCHCYPGYFFDTDTKICEPNTKLTQDFRRHYEVGVGPREYAAPINNGAPAYPSQAMPAQAPPVEDAAADTGDISDWLYNQFFKTIENQVINKTASEELFKGTRRSGGSPPKRKYKKSSQKGKKGSKKAMKYGLRRKLLRITEDDSMFDSESSESSSGSRDASSSSWESWDYPPEERDRIGKAKDHGHRKIVVYNKKPKPPLPSFIFLPNVQTPFYPPIGLPAPPVPMYPMIPIPPIHPPPDCVEDYNSTIQLSTTPKSETTASSKSSTPPTPTTTAAPETPDNPDTPPITESTTTTETTSEKPTTILTIPTTKSTTTNTTTVKSPKRNGNLKSLRQGRNNFLKALRERSKPQQILKRMGTMGKKFTKSQRNHFMDQLQDPSMLGANSLLQQPIESPNQEKDDLLQFEDDVDFKYLTQLIHRVDGNKTMKPVPTIEFNPDRNIPKSKLNVPTAYRKAPIMPGRLQAALPTRRRLDAESTPPEDYYYTNLGRQIASLIRGLNPDGFGKLDVNLGHSNGKEGFQPYFGDNSFAPRSYWERYVRSPSRLDLGYFTKFEDIKASNEKLFDLEDKVQLAAKTPPVLGLLELENLISAMSKVQKEIHIGPIDKKDNKKTSNSSLNVSLLPLIMEKSTAAPKKPISKVIINTHYNKNTAKVANRKKASNRKSKRRNDPRPMNVRASNNTRINHTNKNHFFDHIPAQAIYNSFRYNLHSTTPYSLISNHLQSTRLPALKYQVNPVIINRNNVNNYYANSNKNIFPNLSTARENKYYEKPSSYFFNELEYIV